MLLSCTPLSSRSLSLLDEKPRKDSWYCERFCDIVIGFIVDSGGTVSVSLQIPPLPRYSQLYQSGFEYISRSLLISYMMTSSVIIVNENTVRSNVSNGFLVTCVSSVVMNMHSIRYPP
jgi:hypothetical protein